MHLLQELKLLVKPVSLSCEPKLFSIFKQGYGIYSMDDHCDISGVSSKIKSGVSSAVSHLSPAASEDSH